DFHVTGVQTCALPILEREYNDLEEVWKAEKATVQGATKIKEQIEAAKLELESAQRAQDYARMSELQYGRLPELEKQLKAAQEAEIGRASCRERAYSAG